jgi:hypothetical protein
MKTQQTDQPLQELLLLVEVEKLLVEEAFQKDLLEGFHMGKH